MIKIPSYVFVILAMTLSACETEQSKIARHNKHCEPVEGLYTFSSGYKSSLKHRRVFRCDTTLDVLNNKDK